MTTDMICRSHNLFLNHDLTRVTRCGPLVKQELSTLPEHLSVPLVFSEVQVVPIFSFLCSVLFVLLFLYFWPCHCLSLVDLRLLVIPVVFSNFSIMVCYVFNIYNTLNWNNTVFICSKYLKKEGEI